MIVMDDGNTLSKEELEDLIVELPNIIHELEIYASQEERLNSYTT
jgi:hypothetical protein